MAVKSVEVNKIVARCRRIGWDVEVGHGSGKNREWTYRITRPDGIRVQLHSTPSDRNWRSSVMRQLDADDLFTNAENEWIEAEEKDRKKRIEDDRRQANTRAKKIATKAAAQSAAISRAAGDLAVTLVDINWLLTPSLLPQTRTVLMTPEAAQKVLDTANTTNRKRRDERVAEFVSIIERGEWAATHQGVAIDTAGKLQDGQHRLQALADTGETLPLQVSVGMPEDNFRKVDTPLMRTARDAAWMRGETNVGILTATAKMLLHIDDLGGEAHTKFHRNRISIDRTDKAIIAYGDELRHAVKRAVHIRTELKIKAASVAAALYLIGHRLPEGDPRVEKFFEDLESGVGITKADPVWLLRRLFIRAADLRGQRLTAWETLAYVMKAWNVRASGAEIRQLVWRSNEPFPCEPFLPAPLEDRAAADAAAVRDDR